MCGIAGMVFHSSPPPRERLADMLDLIVHRGPDDWGRYDDEHCSLGMRRLSIIDLSGGHQPMSNEDGTVQVVFNGEIYNYVELRRELLLRGHRFRTRSDTEVIVHLYEEQGEDFALRLNGMFAIALWDRGAGRLLLVRDPLGIKPLYWWLDRNGGGLVFASELKCFLPLLGNRVRVERAALAAYLHLGYIPRGDSPLEGVRKLLPGRILGFSGGGEPTIRRYWTLEEHVARVQAMDRREAARRVGELLDDAVRIRLRSDVPVGTFLSGGLDSSTVTALAARHAPRISSFGIAFEDHFFDETPYARAVAAHVGSDHREIPVAAGELLEHLDRLAWHLDEPNWDPAVLPSYIICREARRSVKVALSGIGGDELFGGYHRHLDPPPLNTAACWVRAVMPGPLRRVVAAVFGGGGRGPLSRWSRLGHDNNVIGLAYWVDQADTSLLREVAPWAAESFDVLEWIETVIREARRRDWVNSRLYYDSTTYLPDQILAVTDRMSMAVSLEVRVPLLDRRLVEFMSGLPGELKVRPGEGKLILKQAARHLLPAQVLKRRKLGFGAPVRRWILARPIRDVIRDLPRGRLAQSGIIVGEALEQVLGSPELMVHHSAFLWSLMMLELWYRWYVGRRKWRELCMQKYAIS